MHEVPLYSRGPYRVLDLRGDGRPRPWIVVDSAGACLRDEVSFEAARAWVDARDAVRQAPAAPPARARPR